MPSLIRKKIFFQLNTFENEIGIGIKNKNFKDPLGQPKIFRLEDGRFTTLLWTFFWNFLMISLCFEIWEKVNERKIRILSINII